MMPMNQERSRDIKAIEEAKGQNLVAVIIVNYCGFSDTIECVESLRQSVGVEWHAYILDNASPDGSGTALANLFEGDGQVSCILFDANLGFGGANNKGAALAIADGYEWLCLLNNDAVVAPDMLEVLVEDRDLQEVRVPLMLYYDDPSLIWYAGGSFDAFGIPRHIHQRDRMADVSLAESTVGFATGCCMLISGSAYQRVGGFDESYFLYWEDVDLSIRLGRIGIPIRFLPDAVLWHKVSSSTGGEGSPLSYYYGTRNRLYAIDKFHLGVKTRLWAVLGLFIGFCSCKPKYKLIWCAYKDYRCGKMGKVEIDE